MNPYKEFLEEKVDIFLSVLDNFGIENGLGLASCPNAHLYPMTGRVTRYFESNKIQRYSTFDLRTGHAFSGDNILIMPPESRGSRKLRYIVSVHIKSPFKNEEERYLEDFNDSAFQGLIAHECAEYVDILSKTPYKKGMEHELRMDDMAKQKGYGNDLINFFEYTLAWMKQDNGRVGNVGFFGEDQKIDLSDQIHQVKTRIKVLKKTKRNIFIYK